VLEVTFAVRWSCNGAGPRKSQVNVAGQSMEKEMWWPAERATVPCGGPRRRFDGLVDRRRTAVPGGSGAPFINNSPQYPIAARIPPRKTQ